MKKKKNYDEHFIKEAIREARKGMNADHGGPFGAIIVRENKIISRAHNMVTSVPDPTAHAEIVAIRKAAKKLGKYHLDDCVLYASSEPCPMCFFAIHWARLKRIYYACDRSEAAAVGFDDSLLWRMMRGEVQPQFKIFHLVHPDYNKHFKAWEESGKEIY